MPVEFGLRFLLQQSARRCWPSMRLLGRGNSAADPQDLKTAMQGEASHL